MKTILIGILCFGLWTSPISVAVQPKAERSLLVKSSVLHANPLTVPNKDAEVWEWGEYVADCWNGYDSKGLYTEVDKNKRTIDGSPIDVYTTKYLSVTSPDCCTNSTKGTIVWEVRRAYDWQRAIGRVGKIKGMVVADFASIILVVDNFNKDQEYILAAKIACDALNIQIVTVDMQGVIH